MEPFSQRRKREALFWDAIQMQIGHVTGTVKYVLSLQGLCCSGALGLIGAGDIPEMESESKDLLGRMKEGDIVELFSKRVTAEDLSLCFGERKVILLIAQVVRERGIGQFLPQQTGSQSSPPKPVRERGRDCQQDEFDYEKESSDLLQRIRGDLTNRTPDPMTTFFLENIAVAKIGRGSTGSLIASVRCPLCTRTVGSMRREGQTWIKYNILRHLKLHEDKAKKGSRSKRGPKGTTDDDDPANIFNVEVVEIKSEFSETMLMDPEEQSDQSDAPGEDSLLNGNSNNKAWM